MAITFRELEFSSRDMAGGGHVVRVDYEIGGKPFTEYVYSDAALTLAEVYAGVKAKLDPIKVNGDTTYTITCQDGTVGVAQPGGTNAAAVSLAITLTAGEQTAWGTMRPKLKTYMAKVLFLYRRANPAQRTWLRAHNAVLDAVLDVIGE